MIDIVTISAVAAACGQSRRDLPTSQDRSLEAGVLDIRVAPLALPAPGFERLTFPHYRPLLLGTDQADTTQERLAVGAWPRETPAGLVFFSPQFKRDEEKCEPGL